MGCGNFDISMTKTNSVINNHHGNGDLGCIKGGNGPQWFYFRVGQGPGQSGDIRMKLSAAQDVDFAIFGPIPTLATHPLCDPCYYDILFGLPCPPVTAPNDLVNRCE